MVVTVPVGVLQRVRELLLGLLLLLVQVGRVAVDGMRVKGLQWRGDMICGGWGDVMRGILLDKMGVRHDRIDRNVYEMDWGVVVVTSVVAAAATVAEIAFSERGMGVAVHGRDYTHRLETSIDLAISTVVVVVVACASSAVVFAAAASVIYTRSSSVAPALAVAAASRARPHGVTRFGATLGEARAGGPGSVPSSCLSQRLSPKRASDRKGGRVVVPPPPDDGPTRAPISLAPTTSLVVRMANGTPRFGQAG